MCRQSGWRRFGLLFLGAVLVLSSAGSVLALTGGPDRYGYRFIDSREADFAYEYEPIDDDKNVVDYKEAYDAGDYPYGKDGISPSDQNQEGMPIEIGFDFEFYGKTYRYLYLAGNGYIEFTPTTFRNYVYDGSGLPSKNLPNNLIAPLWGWHDAFS